MATASVSPNSITSNSWGGKSLSLGQLNTNSINFCSTGSNTTTALSYTASSLYNN